MNLTSKIDINCLNEQGMYLGRGTFGKVFMKKLDGFGDVAIKRIAYIDEEDFEYFKNEFRILKLISDQEGYESFIPKFFGYLQEENLTYFIFEALYIDLHKYQNLLLKYHQRRYLPLDNAKNISMQILNGLSFLHSNGIVHCDLKPSNIVFCDNESNQIKIIDFGLSKKTGEVIEHNVQTSSYRAPEVWMGKNFDCPIDMWSFGAILYEMLIGTYMFYGKNDDLTLKSIFDRYGKFLIEKDSIKFDNSRVKDSWELNFNQHPNYNERAINLIKSCMECFVENRLTADMAMFNKFYHIDEID